jgi:hypothetical protein
MFCCSGPKADYTYQVVSKDRNNNTKVEYVNDINSLSKATIEDQNVKITKVKMSDFTELEKSVKLTKTKFTDETFPPNDHSLGVPEGSNVAWKRIS